MFYYQVIEHTGGVPGFLSVISRFPNDGLGIAVFTNWDGGGFVMETIKYKVAEKALKLNVSPNWDARFVLSFHTFVSLRFIRVLLDNVQRRTSLPS